MSNKYVSLFLRSALPAIFMLTLGLPTTAWAQIIIDVDVVHYRLSDDMDKAPSVAAFPNPTADLLTLQTEADNPFTEVRLLDLSGRRLLHDTPSQHRHKMDLRSLPAQTYILEIKTEKGITRKKIVRQ